MKDEIKVFQVKQYNSTYKNVVVKNGVPLFITKSRQRAELLSSLLQGYGNIEDVKDGTIKKIIKNNIA